MTGFVHHPQRCRRCGHMFHKRNPCTTVEITGPADPNAKSDGGHGIRTETPCDCSGFTA